MYTAQTNDIITQYTLSPANDISSASAAGKTVTITGTGTVNSVRILGFNSDGTILIVSHVDSATGNGYVSKWTLSTGWDISTASATSEKSMGTMADGTTAALSGCLSSDGTSAFLGGAIVGQGGGHVREFTMTAYDVTTLSGNASNTMSTALTKAGDLCCNSTADTFYCTDNTGVIYTYELATAEDLTTYTGALGTYNPPNPGTTTVGISVFNSDTDLALGEVGGPDKIWKIDVDGTPTGRGALAMNGIYYAVMGSTLYSITSAGVTSDLGGIAGSARVVMETDGLQLVITTGTSGGTIYVYSVSAGLVTVTDADIEDDALSSAYLDLAFYFDQDSGNIIASANNDATSFDALDKVEMESFADNVLRTFGHNTLLYAFGETSTEIWYTSGVGRPPIDFQHVIERGIVGTHAAASIDDMVFFVDQFRRPNVMTGIEYQPIYSPGIAAIWDGYSTVSDCFVITYSWEQQSFVEFTFPTENASWTYHVQSGKWLEREHANGTRSRAVSYEEIYGELLALDHTNGRIYKHTETVYQDLGADINRRKDTGLVTAEIYQEPSIVGSEMICNSLRITAESTGAATLTVTLSKDGAAFGQSRTITLTSGSQVRELNAWGKFREAIWRIATTSNAGVDLISVSADLEVLSG